MFLHAGYILEDVQGEKEEMVITNILTYLVLFWRAFLGVERWIIWVLFLLVQAKGPQVVAQTVVMGLGWSVEGTVMVMTLHRKAFGMLPCSRLSLRVWANWGETGADAVFFPSPCSDDERSQLLASALPQGNRSVGPGEGFHCQTAVWSLSSSPLEPIWQLGKPALSWGDTQPQAGGPCETYV